MSETAEKKIKVFQTVKDRKNLLGIWRLTYKLTNRMGPGGFTARMIDSYIDPLTGEQRHLFDPSGKQLPGYMITKQTTTFDPRSNRQDAHVVDFLLGHPGVFVEKDHGQLDDGYVKAKNSNPRITLVNLDHQELDEIEDDNFIDKLIGKLSVDSGPLSISTKKFRWILAKLNLTYREDKYLSRPKVEKNVLRDRLKKFARQSLVNAKNVDKVLENLTNAQFEYEIKECRRFGIIEIKGGVFYYRDAALGVTLENVILYLTNNTEVYTEIIDALLYESKKELGQ